jgi:4-hydroxybenzoate polyprenyltransferase
MFSVFSAAFGFAVNDLSDAELDRSAGMIRNPVSTNELSRGKSISIALFLLLVSMAALPPLSPRNQLLGLVVVFLYLTYSWLVRAKARPILDVVYHGLCLAILAVMGYTEFRSFNVECLLFVSIVFLLSSISQILQEVRDYETDRKMIMTTVTLLGKKRSLVLCLTLFTSTFSFLLLLIIKGAVPLEMLILSPLTYFIMAPITRAIINEEYEKKMLREIRERRLIMIALLIAVLIIGRT